VRYADDTASSEDAAGGLKTQKREFPFLGMHDPQEAKRSAGAGHALHAAVADPEGDPEASGPGPRVNGAWQSGKDVKQIIAELNPVLRGWGNYFRTGNADRSSTSWTDSLSGACAAGSFGGVGSGRHTRRLGPVISFTE
jgi:hypothetical protein